MALSDLESKKLELVRLKKQLVERLTHCFDAKDPSSRPTPVQMDIIKDIENRIFWLIGGNRCFVKGTLVATPAGPKPIEELQVGETVYNEHGQPIKILKTFQNGVKEVADMSGRQVAYASCTKEHKWLVNHYSKKAKSTLLYQHKVQAGDILEQESVVRVRISAPLGNKHEPQAYALGALLGDGCGTSGSKKLYMISSINERIPTKVAALLGTTATKCPSPNYNWTIKPTVDSPLYLRWCHNRKAHEKFVDLEELKTWDRESLIAFVAGVFDTDGGLTRRKDKTLWAIGMQAKSVIDAIEYALLALWNVQAARGVDARARYKNGPVHLVRLAGVEDIRTVMQDLNKHIVSPQKKLTEQDLLIGGKRSRKGAQKLIWGANKRAEETFDIHVDSPTNLYLLANGLVTSNSGKSALGARMVSWWFEENHPYQKRPERWGDQPLQILILGRTLEQLESEIWEKKIRPLLSPGCYKVERSGQAIQRVINTQNNNRIIFISHHNAEEAREKAQAYTANIVWLDEMPGAASLISELLMRVLADDGLLYATFTPLEKIPEIRQLIEAPRPKTRLTKLLMLDNPIYNGREEEIKVSVRASCTSEAEYQSRMFGEWYEGDSRVFAYDSKDNYITALPATYSPSQPHVAVVDPSASGLTGLSVWTYYRERQVWLCVLAKYINGSAAFELVDEVERLLSPYNIVLRKCDCNPAGFYKEANSQRRRLNYHAVVDKKDRKLETIDKLNTGLKTRKILLGPDARDLGTEFIKASWSETLPNKIAGESKLHLIDTARYFYDDPPRQETVMHIPPEMVLPLQWERRKKEMEKTEMILLQRRNTGPRFFGRVRR